jgi:hypothetical protein
MRLFEVEWNDKPWLLRTIENVMIMNICTIKTESLIMRFYEKDVKRRKAGFATNSFPLFFEKDRENRARAIS